VTLSSLTCREECNCSATGALQPEAPELQNPLRRFYTERWLWATFTSREHARWLFAHSWCVQVE